VGARLPTLEQNRFWDRYNWPQDGDEWTDQARFCGMAYSVWKQDLVDTFIVPSVTEKSTVLDLGVGHGRWTPILAHRAQRYIGVDFNPLCLDYCRRRFAGLANAEFLLNDGRALSLVTDRSIQFIWSYDSFVHIEPDITQGYLAEFARVLSPGGRCTIHHPGSPDPRQCAIGGRSAVTAALFARLASACGLRVLAQVDSWGPGNRSNARLFSDCISTLEK
jgi:ubiquinone/menaquinone biosynthesis C-methylase UbiE